MIWRFLPRRSNDLLRRLESTLKNAVYGPGASHEIAQVERGHADDRKVGAGSEFYVRIPRFARVAGGSYDLQAQRVVFFLDQRSRDVFRPVAVRSRQIKCEMMIASGKLIRICGASLIVFVGLVAGGFAIVERAGGSGYRLAQKVAIGVDEHDAFISRGSQVMVVDEEGHRRHSGHRGRAQNRPGTRIQLRSLPPTAKPTR